MNKLMRQLGISGLVVTILLLWSSSLWAEQEFFLHVPIDTVIRDEEDSRHVLAVEPVDEEYQEQTGEATLTIRNNKSIHPNSNIWVESANTIVFLNVESGSFISQTIGGLVLGSVVTVTVELGEDGVFSGGLDLVIVLEEVEATPTSTPTDTSTPTNTSMPTSTPTNTPIPTSTPTATHTPTPTPAVAPPEEIAAQCIVLHTVPELPQALPEEGLLTDIHVQYSGESQDFVLYDGTGYLYFETQPIMGIRVYPNRIYKVMVSEEDKGCVIGAMPTGMKPVPQPRQTNFNLWISLIKN